MTDKATIAQLLLDIQAVALNIHHPFRYTSGLLSPIYCDNRQIMSYPRQREQIIRAFLSLIKQKQLSFDVVAGTATAGIPHAAWIADHLRLPMIYVRSEPKKHGKQNQIEGHLEKESTVLVVEDLISTGGSAIQVTQTLREAGNLVHDCIAIFDYQLATSARKCSEANLNIHALSDFTTLIDVAVSKNYLNDNEKKQALSWQKDPEHWSKNFIK